MRDNQKNAQKDEISGKEAAEEEGQCSFQKHTEGAAASEKLSARQSIWAEL